MRGAMGCGASSGDKYKGEAVASTAKGQQDARGADAEPAKAEPVKTEPPPEKPPQEAPPAQEEAKAAPAAEATAVEPPTDARPEAAEAPPAEAPVAAEAPAAEAPAEVAPAVEPQPSEPAQSLAAEAVVAEAEAALAESEAQTQVEPTPSMMHVEDPEFPSFRGMSASALMELDRSSGSRLGICVREAESVLLITKVEEDGLVPAWNQEHPERAVRPGNCVIQVNGLCGIAEQMLEELQTEQSLRVEVDRTEREVRAALTSAGMAHWCREQIQQVYERHDEAGLKTLDRRMNTYKDRELALYRTLSKKFGEEPKDPEMCPNSIEDVEL